MDVTANNPLQVFKNLVGIKFEMYNALFTSLPFHTVERTGVLLSLFLLHIEDGFKKEKSPSEILETFFHQYTDYRTEEEQLELLFRFVQYSERQVVLFDALEDAAFPVVNEMQGAGTLKHLQSDVKIHHADQKVEEKLNDFAIRLVLTAHPTQFYPSEVLGIIHDLAKALANDNVALVNSYLQQLGKTPFFKKQKPSPYDEAVNLIWFLENVFYQSAGQILSTLKSYFPNGMDKQNSPIRMGFWPGGDRDGNPFVKSDTTLKVADALRSSIIKSYYREVRNLRRRLTFEVAENILETLEQTLYNHLFIPGHKADISKEDIRSKLIQVRDVVAEQHHGLFLNLVENMLSKVDVFGLFFATLDIRQDSSVHAQLIESIVDKASVLPKNYRELNEEQKIEALLQVNSVIENSIIENEVQRDVLQTMHAVKTIQKCNGEEGSNRYIISHSTSALNVIEVYSLFMMSGWKAKSLTVDIAPLFETIDDLRNAGSVMKALYENKVYRKHLERRNNTQTIMLGFSDGTKDGGYLMANWSIYKAKEELSFLSSKYDIQVVFFDGRGGPPARGGGKTHQFYASMGSNIANKEIQLTIQGQTISSNFGTIDAARYNMEQLMHAGLSNGLVNPNEVTLSEKNDHLLQSLANESYKAYNTLKTHPVFIEYLNYISPLRYYAETNIGSRPAKRNSGKLNLNDLRAVPYVGSWSQLKQNLPGYYGVGTAFEKLEADGKWEEIKHLYKHSLFFNTLIDNCEMAMSKCYFPVTAYLAKSPKYGELWTMIHEEYLRTKKYILRLSGASELMGDKPASSLSIQMRQRIELPLITIQQHALTKIREVEEHGMESPEKKIYEKLVMRCSFGIINAERNSA